jgi:hypothetical protein
MSAAELSPAAPGPGPSENAILVVLFRPAVNEIMRSTEIQATTSVTFRVSGAKPSPVHVFAKGGRKWIVASEVCRILGFRTDTVPKLLSEQDRGTPPCSPKAACKP